MRKRAWIAIVIALILCSPLLLRLGVALRFAPRTHAPHAVQEPRYAAVVLGARVYPNGEPSAMLADRIGAAVDLYHAGHVDVVVMSGDGREPSYDEPGAMARYAMQRGVPPEDIILDRGGTRTYDSCYRLGHVLGIDSAYLVSQNFHLDRALMLCNGLGIHADGVFADTQRPWGYSDFSLTRSRIREIPALTLAIYDLLSGRTPTFSDLEIEEIE